jgi:CubicO group peptidase (beta-lactamase class C family)
MISRLSAALAMILVSPSLAYCPPTGPVLPIPNVAAPDNLTSSLCQSLEELSQVSAHNFNLSATSFSVQITTSDTTIFEFHHTAPARNCSSVNSVDGDTVYRIASVTKMMTVYALLLQQNVNLDDPVTNYVPKLLDSGLGRYQKITLRMLAGQISGAARDGTDEHWTNKYAMTTRVSS